MVCIESQPVDAVKLFVKTPAVDISSPNIFVVSPSQIATSSAVVIKDWKLTSI